MYVIQYENLKIHRDKLIELKNLDSEFNYSFENDKLFFLMYNEKIYGYAIIALKGKNVVLEGSAEKKIISVDEQKHYAEDAKKPQSEIDAITKPQEEIRFVASGIKVVN